MIATVLLARTQPEPGGAAPRPPGEAGRWGPASLPTTAVLFPSETGVKARIARRSYRVFLASGSGQIIEGHTDSDGSDAANQTLSQSRAEAVMTYLVSTDKVDPGRLESKGWGEIKPIDTKDTAEGKANNRRVELVKR